MKYNLSTGIPLEAFADSLMVLAKHGEVDVIVVRTNEKFYAVGAHCTHYHGPLQEGLIVDDTVRCPWHHACFSLKTGEALRAPALDPIQCWNVGVRNNKVYVLEEVGNSAHRKTNTNVGSIVIVGGGAAGLAAAEILRREGYHGGITMVSADSYPPCDRPNLSKDYLSGSITEDWLPLRSADYYADQKIHLLMNTRVTAIDTNDRSIRTDDSMRFSYDALLIATGSEPIRLQVPGIDSARVHYLRSFADCSSIINNIDELSGNIPVQSLNAVVVGASFIGLEAAAALRTRGLNVHVVAPETQPLERVLGNKVGEFIKSVHEERGVVFHLQNTVARTDGKRVILSDGTALSADIVVVGIGVRPQTEIAHNAGIHVDNGILVNQYLETNIPGIYAAGDVARWFDTTSNKHIRVEHWVVAERQGQIAAKNMIGKKQEFDSVPFFWSQHFDTVINYTGYAPRWDYAAIEGSLYERDCRVTYRSGGVALAVATINRDLDNLQSELEFEMLR